MSASILALATLLLASPAPTHPDAARARAAGILALRFDAPDPVTAARSATEPSASPYAALLESSTIRSIGHGGLGCRRGERCAAAGTIPSDRPVLHRVGACDHEELDELAFGVGRARAMELCIDRAHVRR